MMGLLGTYIILSAIAFLFLRFLRMHRREVWAFTILACIGFVLWTSIVLNHPLDLNQAIGRMIDSIK
ncbi:hypothetical protein [Paenibacillus sp. YIM B09110]|uniref:hypothetical protein n=1 Tax=Paenibacillus sp. YIM B09110 TaxID=3126102 RepID=UPI00301D1EC2